LIFSPLGSVFPFAIVILIVNVFAALGDALDVAEAAGEDGPLGLVAAGFAVACGPAVLVHPPSNRPKVTRLRSSALCVLLAVTPICFGSLLQRTLRDAGILIERF
jgi:hypothetical protein